jgi:hypothetical protein
MDGAGDHFVKCQKSVSQRKILHVFSHFGKLGGKQEGKYCGYQWGKGNEG